MMGNKFYYAPLACAISFGLLTGCGDNSSKNHTADTAYNAQVFNSITADAQFTPQTLTPKNGVVYTQAGRLIRFTNAGHNLSLVDTRGVKNGAIREDHGDLLYVPQTGKDQTKSVDTLVYKDSGQQKTTSIQISSDPLYAQEWHLHNTGQTSYTDLELVADGSTDVDMPNALASGYLGKDITVAVVDHGAQLSHPDLVNNVGFGSMNLNSGAQVEGDGMPAINHHGTAVSGIIAETGWNNIGGRGVAPNAKVISFNYLDSSQQNIDFVRSHGFSQLKEPTSNEQPIGFKFDKNYRKKFKPDNLARIYNESWANVNFFPDESVISTIALRSSIVRQGALTGFNGKGIIYLKSAANNEQGYSWSDFGNMYHYAPVDMPADSNLNDGLNNGAQIVNKGLPFRGAMLSNYQNSPYVTVVASLTAQGKQASYSGSGANVFISGLGGERPYGRIITTDLVGCDLGSANINVLGSGVDDFNGGDAIDNSNCDYDASMDGTSAATPVVAGAVADILSVRPELSWRDARYILAKTAKQVDAESKTITLPLKDGALIAQYGWITNAAGFHFNNRYGFGLVDIDKAIKLAKSYDLNNLGQFKEFKTVSSQSLNQPIPDGIARGVNDSLTMSQAGIAETVSLHVNIDHERLNDLEIELISPQGTPAIVLNPYNGIPLQSPEIGKTLNFTFNVNTFFGESIQGDWTLKVVDANKGVYSQKRRYTTESDAKARVVKQPDNMTPGIIHNWSLQINGHTTQVNTTTQG